jgi:glucose uptake protein
MGSVLPLTESARMGGEIEMGPYPIALLFGVAVFATTIFYNIYFMNLPVQGEPLSLFDYLRVSLRQHLAGIEGGLIAGAGIVCCLVAAGVPADSGFRPEAAYTMAMGASLIGMLWALLYRKEFAASSRLRFMMWATAGTLAVGLALVASTILASRK